MSHTIETGSRIFKFENITAVNSISQIGKEDIVILVQNEDTIDIWKTDNRVRGTNELVHYYSAWEEREINELDLIVMGPKGFYF
jgi:hypothetical protein